VQSTVTIDQWFNTIKSNIYISLIEEARELKQQYHNALTQIQQLRGANGSSSEIEILQKSASNIKTNYDIKKKQLPTVTYNATFNSYRNTKNLNTTTGLIYLDVDTEGFDIETIDKSKVFSYYKSVGGLGYSILVRVNNLTVDNYSSTFESIVDDLGIRPFYDKAAKGLIQQSILSYDPNIYINNNSYVFESINDLTNKKCTTPYVNKKEKTYTIGVVQKIRYDNSYKYVEGLEQNEYVSDWKEGFEVIKAWIPFNKIKDGRRYKYLLSYGTNLLFLNQHLNYNGVLNNLRHVNPIACLNPIDESQLVKIAKTLMKQQSDGVLKPIPYKKPRRVIFSENSTLSRIEKQKVSNNEQVKYWQNVSTEKIYNIIENWDFEKFGKITQLAIVNNNRIARVTVQKYWSEFKEYVNSLNEQNNQIKTKKRSDLEPSKVKTYESNVVARLEENKSLEATKIVNTQFGEVTIKDYANALKLVIDAGATEAELLESVEESMNKVFLTDLKIRYSYDFNSNQDFALVSVA
jgi:hypothetical protein